MEDYKMAKSKLIQVNKKIEKNVVGGYKKIENTVVSGYQKIEDKFIDQFLTHEDETIEEAKERIKHEKEKIDSLQFPISDQERDEHEKE